MANSAVNPKASLSDYLAAERTLLAWIRTGLALMGFGFVVARFGLFLKELAAVQHPNVEQSTGLSLWFGTALILSGVIVTLASAGRHVRTVRQLNRGEMIDGQSVSQAVLTAVFLGLVGLAMATYLLSVRSATNQHSQIQQEAIMASAADNGIVSIPSHHSVDQTVDKLTGILQNKGVALFAVIDHSGEAAKVGLKMPPTRLLIFGSPKAGTPLMLAAPSVAIDLPLKILIWEDSAGKVWVSYNSPEYLQQRHGFPQQLLQNIAVIAPLAANAAQ